MDEQHPTSSPDDSVPQESTLSPHQAPDQQSEDAQEELWYRQSLESRMQQLKQDQLDTEESLTNLGLLFDYRIKSGAIMPLEERARTIYEYHYGRDRPEVATRLHRLADFYLHHGEYGLAKPLYEQALAIRQHKLSRDHPDTAATLSALAKLYLEQEHYLQAASLYEEALTIRLKQLGVTHPDTVATMSELMWTYEQLGNAQKADELSRRFGQLQAQATRGENQISSTTRRPEQSEGPEPAANKEGKEAPFPQSERDRLETSQGHMEITIDGEVVNRIEMDQQAFSEAMLELIEKIGIDNTDDPIEGYWVKAILLVQAQRSQEALECGEQAIRLAPERWEPYLKLSQEALTAFEHALRLDASDPITHYNKAQVLMDLKRYEDALQAYDQALHLAPDESRIYRGKGAALARLNRHEESCAALALGRRLSLDYTPHYPYMSLTTWGVKLSFQGPDGQETSLEKAVQGDTSPETLYLMRGTLALHEGHYQEALDLYARASSITPNFSPAYFYTGLALLELARYQEALHAFEQALWLDPNNTLPYSYKSYGLLKLGRPEEALAECEQALRFNPSDILAHSTRGALLVTLGRLEEGIAAYEQALRLEPNNFMSLVNKGLALLQLKRDEQALATFKQAIALSPRIGTFYYWKGIALDGLQRHEEARTAYALALYLQPDLARGYGSEEEAREVLALGRRLMMNTAPACVCSFTTIHVSGPAEEGDNPEEKLFQEGHNARSEERYQDALDAFTEAVRIKPNFVPAQREIGITRLVLDHLPEALRAFEQTIRLKPDDVQAHFYKGYILLRQQQPEEALAACEQAVLFDPAHGRAQCNRGAALIDLKRFEEAVIACNLAIYLASTHNGPYAVSAYKNKGQTLLQLKRDEQALEAFEQAILLAPDEGEYYYQKGIALEGLQRYQEAEQAYGEARRLGYPQSS